jgi:hypothetical protein
MNKTLTSTSVDQPSCAAAGVENAIRILAGSLVLVSLTLAQLVSGWWLLLAAFVGVNLIQSAFTGFCPAETVFRRLGVGSKGAVSSPGP